MKKFSYMFYVALYLITISFGSHAKSIDETKYTKTVYGLELGMTQDVALAIFQKTTEVLDKKEKYRKSNPKMLRNIYANMVQDAFLSIGFSEFSDNNIVTEVSIVYKDKSLNPEIINSFVDNYGKPDETKSVDGLEIFSWGGKIELQGAITPYTGRTLGILIEKTSKQITITWLKFI